MYSLSFRRDKKLSEISFISHLPKILISQNRYFGSAQIGMKNAIDGLLVLYIAHSFIYAWNCEKKKAEAENGIRQKTHIKEFILNMKPFALLPSSLSFVLSMAAFVATAIAITIKSNEIPKNVRNFISNHMKKTYIEISRNEDIFGNF